MSENELTALIETIRPELVRIATSRCGRAAAEDAVQKTLMQAWTNGVWRTKDAPAMARALRANARLKGINEMRGMGRLSGLRRDLRVVGISGCKHSGARKGAE